MIFSLPVIHQAQILVNVDLHLKFEVLYFEFRSLGYHHPYSE